MAVLKNVLGVSASDIKHIMGVAVADIKSVVGLDFPAGFLAYQGATHFSFAGLGNASDTNKSQDIFSMNIASHSSVSDIGDLGTHTDHSGTCGSNVSNGNRIVFHEADGNYSDTLTYFAPASWTGGSLSDFGDLDRSIYWSAGGSNGTIGLMGMGHRSDTSTHYNSQVEKFTIASAANATVVGNGDNYGTDVSVSGSLTKSFWCGGYVGYQDTISEFTYASLGDSDDVGNLSQGRSQGAPQSGSTEARVILAFGGNQGGGSGAATEINYINPASSGDGADFGDYTGFKPGGSPGDGTYMVSVGNKNTAGAVQDDVNHITIASTGNATFVGGILPHNKAAGGQWAA